MNDARISEAFQAFATQTPEHARSWMQLVRGLSEASALDPKTSSLAYLAVLAALRMTSGIPFHVHEAHSRGATREEILSAILVGLTAAGSGVTQALPSALAVLDENSAT